MTDFEGFAAWTMFLIAVIGTYLHHLEQATYCMAAAVFWRVGSKR